MADAWAAYPGEITDIFAYRAVLEGRAEESDIIKNYDEATEVI